MSFLSGTHDPDALLRSLKYKRDFKRQHPYYFEPEGLLVFTGPQGSGKTLSAVQYCKKVLRKYPHAIFCSNVEISGLPEGVVSVPYDGLSSLSDLQNGYEGVLYLIDEIHLEWNSLESKNISVEEMTEFAQQRKQRKHIVGTSQVFMRLAKPLREQIKRVVICENWLGLIQHNYEIDGNTIVEDGGKVHAEVRSRHIWFHTPELYQAYDTFAKMQRYRKAWSSRSGLPAPSLYQSPGQSVRGGGSSK